MFVIVASVLFAAILLAVVLPALSMSDTSSPAYDTQSATERRDTSSSPSMTSSSKQRVFLVFMIPAAALLNALMVYLLYYRHVRNVFYRMEMSEIEHASLCRAAKPVATWLLMAADGVNPHSKLPPSSWMPSSREATPAYCGSGREGRSYSARVNGDAEAVADATMHARGESSPYGGKRRVDTAQPLAAVGPSHNRFSEAVADPVRHISRLFSWTSSASPPTAHVAGDMDSRAPVAVWGRDPPLNGSVVLASAAPRRHDHRDANAQNSSDRVNHHLGHCPATAGASHLPQWFGHRRRSDVSREACPIPWCPDVRQLVDVVDTTLLDASHGRRQLATHILRRYERCHHASDSTLGGALEHDDLETLASIAKGDGFGLAIAIADAFAQDHRASISMATSPSQRAALRHPVPYPGGGGVPGGGPHHGDLAAHHHHQPRRQRLLRRSEGSRIIFTRSPRALHPTRQ